MLAVGSKVGSYTILRQLGEGGIGEVYLADHLRIARKAAIKVLRPEHSRSQTIVERFFAEAKAASLIRHDNIVEILDCDILSDGAAFIVMEYLEGESLEACLARVGSFAGDLRTALWILGQVASALAAAHAKGIVHRDLKPANVFLASDPEIPSRNGVKVLDFGIAKLATDSGGAGKTRTGTIIGTPLYMSPEQCRGAGTVDHRSDIYSLGCMAFELLAGRPPFVREGAGELLVAHISQAPLALSVLQPAIPASVDGLVARMLAKAPQDRPQSMGEVAAALAAVMADGSAHSATIMLPSLAGLGSPGETGPRPSPAITPQPTPPLSPAFQTGERRPLSQAFGTNTTFSNTSGERRIARTGSRAPRNKWLWAGAAATGVLGAVALTLAFAGGKGDVAAPTPTVELQRQPAAIVPPPPLAETKRPSRVRFDIGSDPPGAKVLVQGESHGVTPARVDVETGTQPVSVRLELDGYEAKTLSLVPDENRSVEVSLSQLKAKRRSAPRGRPADDSDDTYLKLKD